MPKSRPTRLDRLCRIVDEIEATGDSREQTALAEFLEGFRQKTHVRSVSLPMQRNALAAAALTKDKAAIKAFEYSQTLWTSLPVWSFLFVLCTGRTERQEVLRPLAGEVAFGCRRGHVASGRALRAATQ